MKKAKKWVAAASVRAIKTMAQVAVAYLGTATFMSEVNWTMFASTTVLSGILSILTSLAGLPEVNGGAK